MCYFEKGNFGHEGIFDFGLLMDLAPELKGGKVDFFIFQVVFKLDVDLAVGSLQLLGKVIQQRSVEHGVLMMLVRCH